MHFFGLQNLSGPFSSIAIERIIGIIKKKKLVGLKSTTEKTKQK
jgi:hypothetical protein